MDELCTCHIYFHRNSVQRPVEQHTQNPETNMVECYQQSKEMVHWDID